MLTYLLAVNVIQQWGDAGKSFGITFGVVQSKHRHQDSWQADNDITKYYNS